MKAKGSALPSPDLLEAIGLLIVAASTADQQIAFQILRLISVDAVLFHAWPVVAGMDFKVKLMLVRTLTSTRFRGEARDWITKCCDQMQTLYQQRNRLAHSGYSGLTRAGRARFQSFVADTQTGVPPQPFVVTAGQIRDWASQLYAWAIEIDRVFSELGLPSRRPTLADLTARLPEDPRADNRQESRSVRTKRKKSSPPPEEPSS